MSCCSVRVRMFFLSIILKMVRLWLLRFAIWALHSVMTFLSVNTYNWLLPPPLEKLGFINRCRKYFKRADTLKLLYCTVVRTQLEYASIFWDPYQLNHILIKRIQHRFLRSMSFKLGKPMKVTEHNYDHLLVANLMILANRRIFLSLSFLHNILSEVIACPELLERIRLHVPKTFRFIISLWAASYFL